MWVAWRSGLPGTWVPGVHANCAHNEIVALQKRSLAPLLRPADRPLSGGIPRVFSRMRGIARSYGGKRWSYLETAESYSGSLRRRYVEAERSLREEGPLRRADHHLRAFLKAEKLPSNKDGKPRMIFPRSPRYNLVLASYLKPFEHWLWGYLTARRLFGGSPTRVVGKGLNPRQRANLIVRKFNQFRDCVVFEVDGKAFEAHVTQAQLEQEHSVYDVAYHDARLRKVLSRQLVLAGTTANGVKFSRPGGRASGDYNTGMGNTLVMLCVVVAVLSGYGISFDVLVDGDNALVFLSKVNSGRVLQDFYQRVFDASGHEMTLEKPVSYLEGVRFGRSAPVFLGHGLGWTMVREPWSVLSGALCSHRWLREPVFGRAWCEGVARCELSIARGVPVLQSWALEILERSENRRKIPVEGLRDYFVLGAWLADRGAVVTVSGDARRSFELAFGVSPESQLRWESSFDGRVGFAERVQELPSSSSWWMADPGLYEAWFDARI